MELASALAAVELYEPADDPFSLFFRAVKLAQLPANLEVHAYKLVMDASYLEAAAGYLLPAGWMLALRETPQCTWLAIIEHREARELHLASTERPSAATAVLECALRARLKML